jgi:LDH2 family malate/lactate/ureidoglycolate dehydrogenase
MRSSMGGCEASHVFTALVKKKWFMPLAEFRDRMGRLVDDIRTSRLRPGFSEVLVPGELEHRRETQKRQDGVPLDAVVFEDLQALAGELGIPFAIKVGA